MKPAYPFRRTCKDVSALLIAREDRALPLADRIALRLHMAMCEACPRFERQLLTMRNAMAQWRHYANGDGADVGCTDLRPAAPERTPGR